MGTPTGRGTTRYSDKVPGAEGNYRHAARFDVTNGYIGITQWTDASVERVLLSPAQMRALVAFVTRKRSTKK